MVLTKTQKEKARIVKLREHKRERGEKQATERWSKVLCAWGKELHDEIENKKAKEKEKTLDYFVYRGKIFLFYNDKKDLNRLNTLKSRKGGK